MTSIALDPSLRAPDDVAQLINEVGEALAMEVRHCSQRDRLHSGEAGDTHEEETG